MVANHVNPYVFGGGLPVTSGLVLWLDAANRGSVTNRWDDRSGNNRHFSSASAGEFPTFANGIASFDGLEVVGQADHLSGPSFTFLNSTGAECFMRLRKPNTTEPTGTSGLWLFGTSGSACHHPFSTTLYNGFGSTARKTLGSPVLSITSWRTLGVITVPGEFTAYLDSTQQFTTASNTVGFSATPWLGRSAGGNPFILFNGEIKSFVIYNRKLSSGERTTMRAYMAAL